MEPNHCHLLDAVGVQEPCPEGQCPFWEDSCLLVALRAEMSRNPPLVRFLLGLREDLEDGSRPLLGLAPGLN